MQTYLLFILILSCTTPSKYPGPDVVMDGFKFSIPRGWVVTSEEDRDVILGKKEKASLVGRAFVKDLKDFKPKTKDSEVLSYLGKNKKAEGGTTQFYEITFRKMNCLRYLQSTRNKAAKQTLNLIGLICLHTKDSRHYIELQLGQNFGTGSFTDISADTESFFASLKSIR